jgi:hypothetical protein
VSGRVYVVERPGAIFLVDPRDRRALAAVPKLKRLGRR